MCEPRDSALCASVGVGVGRISEAPSDTVKYLTNYYQYFMLSSGWRVPSTDLQGVNLKLCWVAPSA